MHKTDDKFGSFLTKTTYKIQMGKKKHEVPQLSTNQFHNIDSLH